MGTAQKNRAELLKETDAAFETAVAARDINAVVSVSNTRARQLDDLAGALEALQAAERILADDERAPLGNWTMLAYCYWDHLSDREGIRRVLTNGAKRCHQAGDPVELSQIAISWAQKLDRDGACALLREAEQLDRVERVSGKRHPRRGLHHIASAWRQWLGEPDEARRVVLSALPLEDDFRHLLSLVKWESEEDRLVGSAALARARGVIADRRGFFTCSNALSLAENAFTAQFEPEIVRRLIEPAAAVANTPSERPSVAMAYKFLLGDEEAAAKLGPWASPPERLRRASRVTIPGWEPSPDLYGWLCRSISFHSLQRLAVDNQRLVELDFAVVKEIAATGLVPLGEVPGSGVRTMLERASDAKSVDILARTFIATLALLSSSAPDELIKLGPTILDGCLTLGGEAATRAENFFAWMASTERPGAHKNEQKIAGVLLWMARAANDPADASSRLRELSLSLLGWRGLDKATTNADDGDVKRMWRTFIETRVAGAAAKHMEVAGAAALLGHEQLATRSFGARWAKGSLADVLERIARIEGDGVRKVALDVASEALGRGTWLRKTKAEKARLAVIEAAITAGRDADVGAADVSSVIRAMSKLAALKSSSNDERALLDCVAQALRLATVSGQDDLTKLAREVGALAEAAVPDEARAIADGLRMGRSDPDAVELAAEVEKLTRPSTQRYEGLVRAVISGPSRTRRAWVDGGWKEHEVTDAWSAATRLELVMPMVALTTDANEFLAGVAEVAKRAFPDDLVLTGVVDACLRGEVPAASELRDHERATAFVAVAKEKSGFHRARRVFELGSLFPADEALATAFRSRFEADVGYWISLYAETD